MTELKDNEKVLLFSTPSCGGCKIIIPMLKGKGLDVEVVDATEQPNRAAEHEVSSVPAFVVEDENGKHVRTLAVGAQEGIKFINEYDRFI